MLKVYNPRRVVASALSSNLHPVMDVTDTLPRASLLLNVSKKAIWLDV